MIRRIHILCMLLLFAVAVVSCRYNEIEPQPGVNGGMDDRRISFVVGASRPVSHATRSSGAVSSTTPEFLTDFGGDSVYVSMTEMENLDPVVGTGSPVVKGAPVTSDNLDEFYVSAYMGPRLKYFEALRMDETDSRMVGNMKVYSLDYYWPQQTLDFYATNFDIGMAYVPDAEWDATWSQSISDISDLNDVDVGTLQPVTRSGSQEPYNWSAIAWDQTLLNFGYDDQGRCKGGFMYNLPEPDEEVRCDAVGQKDYAFAIVPGQVDDGNPVYLDFAHCFAAVTFKLGSEFLDPNGRVVEEVTVTDVPSAGLCSFNRVGDEINFMWNTSQADRKTYNQIIGREVENGSVINDGALTFMFIPHIISEDAVIRVKFVMHASDVNNRYEIVVEKRIRDLFADDAPKEWCAGRKYIYTLSSREEVNLQVRDEFVSRDPLVVGNLEITNKSASIIYVRAYIVGWWENESGDIVSPWLATDGEWTGAAWESGPSDSWKQGSDGFFYYQKPLWSGMSADRLFEEYRLNPGIEPPVAGARLILNVVTQGVAHHRVDEAWPGMIN